MASALWLTITTTLFLFLAISKFYGEGQRLGPLHFPYLVFLGLAGTVMLGQPEQPLSYVTPTYLVFFDIAFSLTTYVFLTLSAISSVAALLQRRALKSKHETVLSRALPTLAGSEILELNLLEITTIIVGFGLFMGILVQNFGAGVFFSFKS